MIENKRQRLVYLDAIRAISTIIIVYFHFGMFVNLNKLYIERPLTLNSPNITYGNIGVTLFFIISGAALMYTYSNSFNIIEYYKKRILGIFPPFYIAYGSVFLIMFYINGTIKHSVPKWTIVYTFLGMDGYLGGAKVNFYLLGEWFLGCIILIYIFFPILRLLLNKAPIITMIVFFIYYILIVNFYFFETRIDWNFIIRIFDFFVGMCFVKYVKKVGLLYAIVSALFVIYIWIVPTNINKMYIITFFSIALFVVLVFLTQNLKNKKVLSFISIVSKNSYMVFLVHHIVIKLVGRRFVGLKLTPSELFCYLLIVIFLISIFSKILSEANNKVMLYLKKLKYKEEVLNINKV